MMTVSSQIHIVVKECFNKWYSLAPYYMAQCVVDIPFLVTLPCLYSATHYWFNKEAPGDAWRFFAYAGLQILNSIIAEAQGNLQQSHFAQIE